MSSDPRVDRLTAFWGYRPDNTRPATDALAKMESAGLMVIDPAELRAALAPYLELLAWEAEVTPDRVVAEIMARLNRR